MVKVNFIRRSSQNLKGSLPFKPLLFLTLMLASISGVGCKSASNEQPERQAQVEREYMEYGEAVAEYIEKIGYEIMVNSAAALEIILPSGFGVTINQVEIGSFLRARNEISRQNGFDFANFMGERVVLYTCGSETDDDLVLLIYDQKLIGAWKDRTGEDFHFIRLNTITP